jgi:hypothetical protein
MQQAHDRMTALGAGLYAVTPASASVNQAVAASLGLRFALLSDPAGESFQAYGLAAADADPAPAVFLLGRNQHLLLAARGMADNPVARSLERLEALAVLDRSQVMAPHPPVLILPDVFSPADCQHLMSIFALQGNVWIEPSHGDQDMADDYKMRVHDYGRMDRIDHFVMTPKNRQFIGARLQARLFPESRKAFQYRITRYEPYRLPARGGSPALCRVGQSQYRGFRGRSPPISGVRRPALSPGDRRRPGVFLFATARGLTGDAGPAFCRARLPFGRALKPPGSQFRGRSGRQGVAIRMSNPTTTSAPSETPTRTPKAE